jgi:hypothetical protein
VRERLASAYLRDIIVQHGLPAVILDFFVRPFIADVGSKEPSTEA